MLVSCLVTEIDERPGELGRWSMENRTDGDGEQERRVKNVGDLDAKAEAEEDANGLWNEWKSCAWDLFLGAEAITPERERDF